MYTPATASATSAKLLKQLLLRIVALTLAAAPVVALDNVLFDPLVIVAVSTLISFPLCSVDVLIFLLVDTPVQFHSFILSVNRRGFYEGARYLCSDF